MPSRAGSGAEPLRVPLSLLSFRGVRVRVFYAGLRARPVCRVLMWLVCRLVRVSEHTINVNNFISYTAGSTSARTPVRHTRLPCPSAVAQHHCTRASAYAAAPAAFLLTAACVAAVAFVPDVVARAAVRTAVLAAAALTAVPAAQLTARVDARASASVAVPASSRPPTPTSTSRRLYRAAPTRSRSPSWAPSPRTASSYPPSRAPSSAHHLRPLSEL